MIAALKTWFAALKSSLAARRARIQKEQFDEGYAWARDLILKSNGQEDPADYIHTGFGKNDYFDRGVRAACHDTYVVH